MKWPYYRNYVNQVTLNHKISQKFSFTNIQGLCSNFVDCESFHVLNSLNVLALWETNWDDSIDSSNFSAKCYLPFVLKDSVTHMHCLAVYKNERLSLPLTCSLKTLRILFISFWLALLYSLSYFFFVYVDWS